ncbi:MAG: tRNA (guanosine(37)-N1)-methyltransferase TrmD [Christensenellales bacterium]|jgi:tRNA (guanine37-N1)-methyltransferase|nr:tRNA (guanosine(37)-N1)-methyltransferase TrmD [Clostridia bacterium]HRU84003.1 tRNA (guanosine(37)-N1)-methyltransferase TrmD [Eubacteriales bacterium]
MIFKVLTLFPEIFEILNVGILGKALGEEKFSVEVINIRDHTLDKHKKCDDYPFGGGAGMVMMPDPISRAIDFADIEHNFKRIYLSPKGKTLNQDMVKELSRESGLVLLCGSYEGVDQRVLDREIDEEISVGDYVLTSGELPALVLINAVSRYIEGVLGSGESVVEESFSAGLLEYPHYTRPQIWQGIAVPDVLISGNHKLIEEWRRRQSEELTKKRRPDLIEKKE